MNCNHHWVGNICAGCGIAYHIWVERELHEAKAPLIANQKECAALREALQKIKDVLWKAHTGHGICRDEAITLDKWLSKVLATEAGKDYVLRAELDATRSLAKQLKEALKTADTALNYPNSHYFWCQYWTAKEAALAAAERNNL